MTDFEHWRNSVMNGSRASSSADSSNSSENLNFSIQGQIVHRRKVSKKLFFFDLEVDSSSSISSTELGSFKIEVIVKYDDVSLDQIAQLWRKVHVGDRVQINGFPEVVGTKNISISPHLLFHCTKIDTLEEYSAKDNGHDPFIPIAPKKLSREANAKAKSGKICKYWISTRKCQLEDECPFLHTEGHQTQWVNQRIMDRRKQAHPEDVHPATTKNSSFHRARIFVDWLINSFGSEYLSSGTGVLDIAGGRGDVSFHLHTVHGIKTTLIDPRERKFNRRQLKIIKKSNESEVETIETSTLIGNPSDHLRCEFNDDFITTNYDLIQNSSILVGMHPDQVTERIAQIAINFGKPFAILPCCVFGHLFPDRIHNGKHVVLYEDFISYLMDLSDDISKDFLNFEGRNIVLWKKANEGNLSN